MTVSIIRLPEVIERTGLSRSTIYFQISKGQFPKGIPIGEHARGWLSQEIEQWIKDKAALRSDFDGC